MDLGQPVPECLLSGFIGAKDDESGGVQSSSQIVTTDKRTPNFFTGRMPFLLPSQECQSTENCDFLIATSTVSHVIPQGWIQSTINYFWLRFN